MAVLPLLRLADIEIDPEQIDAYRAALSEVMQASLDLEPGVLQLNAASFEAAPHVFRLFEVYRDRAAYEAHLQAAHFLDYKQRVKPIVRSLVLHDAGWNALPVKNPSGQPQ